MSGETPGAPAAPLRIAMLAPGYPGGEPGDYRGIFVQQLVGALKVRGHRVCVLTSRIRPGDRPYVRVDENEEVHRFPFWSEGKLLAEYQRVPLARMATYFLSALWRGRGVFGRFGCDLVHSHFWLPTGAIGAALALALGRPHVLSVHGSDAPLALRNKPLRALARWTLGHSQAVTATAAHHREPLERLGRPGLPVTLLPMGIDGSFLAPISAGPGRRAGSILSTRTLQEDPYNVSQLIRAMAIVARRAPHVTCTLAGDGPDRARLAELVRQLGLEERVRLTGWADTAMMRDLLRSHELYVSTARQDGASVSLFEAMASGGYPVLADIAANQAWVRPGENGLLFSLDDPEALASALLAALADPAGRAAATAANRDLAERFFAWSGVAARLEAVYAAALQPGYSCVKSGR